MKLLQRIIVPGLIVALLAVFAVTVLLGGDDSKRVTALFPRTVALYEGSEVRVLGVTVGVVDKVTPRATDVLVEMSYDADVQVPAEAKALIVSPSVVGDRFVQLAPAYQGGAVLADNAKLDLSRTSTPLELDEIYSSIDDLTVALGPTGANKNGALADLLSTTAANWGGQGAQVKQTITDLSTLTGTLDNNKDEIFGTAAQLQSFISTLAENDTTVAQFNQSMAQVSTMLAGERTELAAALRNLAVAMREVSGFVRENKGLLSTNIKGLVKVTNIFVKQRNALDEILKVAPTTLNNLALTYNPQAGTLDTRANLGELVNELQADPATLLCGITNQANAGGDVCDLIQQALPRAGAFGEPTITNPPFDPTLGGMAEVLP